MATGERRPNVSLGPRLLRCKVGMSVQVLRGWNATILDWNRTGVYPYAVEFSDEIFGDDDWITLCLVDEAIECRVIYANRS